MTSEIKTDLPMEGTTQPSSNWIDAYKSEEIANELESEFADEDDQTRSNSNSSSDEIHQHFLNVEKTTRRTRLAANMVVLMGAVAAFSFLYMGISSAKSDTKDLFERRAGDFAKEVDSAWHDYESAASWVHSACRNWRHDNFTHEDFEAVYLYLIAAGLDFYAVDWLPNITHDERAEIEETEGAFWKTIEGAEGYSGFMGQEPDPENAGQLVYTNRSVQDFYYPIYFVEPKDTTAGIIHYDLYSAPWERPAMTKAIETYQPALTGRFVLAQHSEDEGYSVILYHPGVPLPPEKFDTERRDFACIIMNINLFLQRAARYQSEPMSVYLYDTTLTALDGAAPEFLGGVTVDYKDGDRNQKEVILLKETEHASLQNARLYFERDVNVGARTWTTVVVPVDGSYEEELPFVYVTGIIIFLASILLAIWMIHNMQRSIQLHKVISKASAEASIVSNLFPANIRERMIQDAEARNNARASMTKDVFRNDRKGGEHRLSENRLHRLMTSEGVFGTKPIAELHPYTTCMIADLCNFTAWASVREPCQVFTLLELIYHAWDSIGQRRRIYKVETVGDSYVAIAGCPEPRKDHAVAMARFSTDCMHRLRTLVKALEKTLGPDTGDLGARFGLHSGQCVAGVLRGDKGRFQLFGDTVNMAARMESTGVCNKIQCSQETADLLAEAGRSRWLIAREEPVNVKGKGLLKTFFLNVTCGSKTSSSPSTDDSLDDLAADGSRKIGRLIEWNVEVLSGLLRSIVARRSSMGKKQGKVLASTVAGSMVLDEVVEIITLPEYNASDVKKQIDPETISLDPEVVGQLTSLVQRIASSYRANPFHSFEHASHVVMSVLKMMGRIVAPKELASKRQKGSIDQTTFEAELNDHTFGISADPLTSFACAFSALIHDVDHQGIPNTVLVKEESPLAAKYSNKSVAEQNSVDLAWAFLMDPEYDQLRACICCDDEEFARFRSLVVNSVMATDIMDKELGAARKARWSRAFKAESDDLGQSLLPEDAQAKINRKATIVIEHLIQASDVSHTMQHWHVYAKWNQRLFTEMYKAYKSGRLDKDPSESWFTGEMGFFDFYIIPLAKKLFTCGVFGVSSDEFLNYALINRKEWEQKGEGMVQQYLEDYQNQLGSELPEEPMSLEV
ncbi:Receptor-type guanylate cyclase gcy [Seminavis robusta]|uniref:Phosphodiesterase n=1 Tax=Seminavis robusta TaxID=568900 RepID=A0A9N8HA11_9STRA|nr:Receptor-type guanylate cyclase gcy [Seminavis robusta]|eukprot:Sro225_g091920.1 Receptor-type guanylate cyclase gcy (1135) ;mRNA; r:79430-84607